MSSVNILLFVVSPMYKIVHPAYLAFQQGGSGRLLKIPYTPNGGSIHLTLRSRPPPGTLVFVSNEIGGSFSNKIHLGLDPNPCFSIQYNGSAIDKPLTISSCTNSFGENNPDVADIVGEPVVGDIPIVGDTDTDTKQVRSSYRELCTTTMFHDGTSNRVCRPVMDAQAYDSGYMTPQQALFIRRENNIKM